MNKTLNTSSSIEIMDKFFNPKSVVVIGASNSPFNLGSTICNALKKLLKYEGKVYAVNRKGEEVCGCTGFISVNDINENIDLAVIIIPSNHVCQAVKECGEKGIKNIIIESSGFAEGGEEGNFMQKQLDALVREYNLRIMGPNCLGVLNTHNKFCCFYGLGQGDELINSLNYPGTISYIIQSGGVGVLILESFITDVVKVNKMVSIGNKADVDEADLIEFFDQDNTKVICLYLENIQHGKKFFNTAKKVKKPILVYKVGRTDEGAKAAMSHTAGMANNDKIFDSVCKQSGVIRLNSINELHTLPKIFTTMPILSGRNIAIFTNSGAFGAITSDLLINAGLLIPKLSLQTQERLKKTGTLYNVTNPIDLGPTLSIQTYVDIFNILLSADEVDGVLAVPSLWQDFVLDAVIELIKLCQIYKKPAVIYPPNSVKKTVSIREKYQLPLYESPEEAVRALSVSYEYYNYILKKENLDE